MEQENVKQIDNVFIKLQEDASKQIRKMYNDIQERMKNTDGKGLGGEIAQMEARKLNGLIVTLMEDVRQASMKEMIANGSLEYLTPAGWNEIQQVVSVPRIELCKVKVDSVNPDEEKEYEKANLEQANKTALYKSLKTFFSAAAGAGAAVIVVHLFVPGLELPVAVYKTAKAASIIGVGGYLINEYQRSQEVSKFSDPPEQDEEKNLDDLLSQIIDSQYNCNKKIYFKWLEEVKKALIAECDKLAAMSNV